MRTDRLRALPYLLLLALAVALAMAPTAALAATGCGGVVRDDAGQLSDTEVDDVTAAAERLAALGVRPIVVVIESLGVLPLEQRLEVIIRDCPGLTDAAGEWGGNVLGVLVSTGDRETGVFEGGALPALDVTQTNVDTEVMNPRFAEGDLAGGLVAGLDRMTSIQAAAQNSAEPSAGGSGVPWAAGGAAAVGLVGAGGTALVRTRRRQQARAEAHAAAAAVQADVNQQIIDLQRDRDVMRLDGRRLADRLGGAEATPLRERMQGVSGVVESVTTRWFALTSQLGPTPDADAATYTTLAERMRDLRPVLDEAAQGVAGFNTWLGEVEVLESGLGDRIAALVDRHEAIRQAVADAQGRGFRTDPAEDDLRLSIDAMARAEQTRQANLVLGTDQHLDLAEAAGADALDWLTNIDQMRKDMDEDLRELQTQRAAVLDRVERLQRTMEDMEDAYAPSAWEQVAGNGSEAEAELAAAAAALDASAHAQLLDVQDWDLAEESLEEAADDLHDATILLDAIDARSAALQEATDLLPATLSQAKAASSRADAYARDHAADVDDDAETQISLLAGRAVALGEGVDGGGRNDPLALMAEARLIQTEVADLLSKAEEQVTAADLARRRAERTLRDAERELADMISYVRGRSRYVTKTERIAVERLHRRLGEIQQRTDPVAQEAAAVAIRTELRQLHQATQARIRRARGQTTRTRFPRSGGTFGGSGGRSSGGSRRPSSTRRPSSSSSRSRRGGSSSRSRSRSGGSRSGRSSRW